VSVPRLLVLTDRHRCAARGRSLREVVTAAVEAGAPAVLLREKDLPPHERHALAVELAPTIAAAGAQLIVASDAEVAADVGADGVHLAATDPVPARAGSTVRAGSTARAGSTRHDGRSSRPDDPVELPAGTLIGRSCHDEVEVRAAVDAQLDYVTVSPVAPTASKPGYGPALDVPGLAQLAAVAGDLPVLALGGAGPDTVARWCAAGAAGVAVLGAVMGARDPAAVVRALLEELPPEPAPVPRGPWHPLTEADPETKAR
jgi:thiamine-phosphate pyrophosphorylase